MTFLKVLLPVTITIATAIALLPETAEARPRSITNRSQGRGGPKAAPELSLGAAASALGLLGGGIMVIVGRRRKRN
jgi:hypothetical protein